MQKRLSGINVSFPWNRRNIFLILNEIGPFLFEANNKGRLDFKSRQSFFSTLTIDLFVNNQQHEINIFVSHLFEVFVNNTNLTFLSFLYKINIEVSKKIKLPPVGFEH